ncbi:YidH family protein [Gordonia sp. (in: high G+C Gram-positive bacteria)]|uniref:YidH family protein n=1 Tax=Gordonia sp. (in: high G+C Gram-positive bacteria) TaxID=84139 RepID=UPI003C771800
MPDTKDFLFDEGAQNERTRLAWTRMALAFMAGSALLFRAVPTAPNPTLAALPAAICLTLGAILFFASFHRYNRNQRALKHHEHPMPDGVMAGIACAVSVGGGIIATVLVVIS